MWKRSAHENWNKRDFAGVVKLVPGWTITWWRAMLKPPEVSHD